MPDTHPAGTIPGGAEKHDSLPVRSNVDEITRLRKLYELGMGLSGDPVDVFRHMSRLIGELMDVKVVCLSEIRGEELFFLSVYVQGRTFVEAGSSPIAVTPCATVRDARESRVYEAVIERFPEAAFLRKYNAFSYCGFPSLGSDGSVLGVTCLLDDRPHAFSEDDHEILRIFGQRIALEIERQQHMRERARAQEELRRHKEKLEDLVAERTGELQEINRDLESFSYSLSHDLRGHLGVIDGFCQILEEDEAGNVSPKGRNYLRSIREASQRMGDLVDDMLKLSRISRTKLQLQPVDISALATRILRSLEATEKDRKVVTGITPELVARADPGLLEILLYNLLGNAWKFTRKRESARIEMGARIDDGRRVFFVRDNGAGFDMRFAEKLFQAFQRLHSDREFLGTGIGLATVKRIVDRHGGEVWAEAREGEGATFYFALGEERENALPGHPAENK